MMEYDEYTLVTELLTSVFLLLINTDSCCLNSSLVFSIFGLCRRDLYDDTDVVVADMMDYMDYGLALFDDRGLLSISLRLYRKLITMIIV